MKVRLNLRKYVQETRYGTVTVDVSPELLTEFDGDVQGAALWAYRDMNGEANWHSSEVHDNDTGADSFEVLKDD